MAAVVKSPGIAVTEASSLLAKGNAVGDTSPGSTNDEDRRVVVPNESVDVRGPLACDGVSGRESGMSTGFDSSDVILDRGDATGSGATIGGTPKDESVSLLAGNPPTSSGLGKAVDASPSPVEATRREDLWNVWSGGGSAI